MRNDASITTASHFNTRIKHIQNYDIIYLTSLCIIIIFYALLCIIEELFTVHNLITLILNIFILKKIPYTNYFFKLSSTN